MTIRCPVCRADNDSGPACRRCKADLTPLFELDERRGLALHEAARAAVRGDGELVLRHAREAMLLRAGSDALQWLAVASLLRRDYAAAISSWRAACRFAESSAGR
jgi:hypothetical protein